MKIDQDTLISADQSIKAALKKLSKTGYKTIIVVDDGGRIIGTITDGDIRRHLLKGGGLDSDIKGVFNRNPVYIFKKDYSLAVAKDLLVKHSIEFLPILDDDRRIVSFVTWQKAFLDTIEKTKGRKSLDIPVVIMAGGKGSRLEPFSNIFPKALVPIGDKPIIEMVIDEFVKNGVQKFFLLLNHKAEMIESYFNNIKKDYKITCRIEKDFYGTAGAISLLRKDVKGPFIVSNCDVIVKADFSEVLKFHNEHTADLTILSSIQHYKIPYGIIEFKKGGEVTDAIEKPEYTFTINTGVYILSEQAARLIPAGKRFDMTELIGALIKDGKRVFTYPVNENDYVDIGQWGEYRKAVEKMGMLK